MTRPPLTEAQAYRIAKVLARNIQMSIYEAPASCFDPGYCRGFDQHQQYAEEAQAIFIDAVHTVYRMLPIPRLTKKRSPITKRKRRSS